MTVLTRAMAQLPESILMSRVQVLVLVYTHRPFDTGMSRSVIPYLASHGIQAYHIGNKKVLNIDLMIARVQSSLSNSSLATSVPMEASRNRH